MCIEPELLDQFSGIIDTSMNDPIICCWVNTLTGKGSQEKRILFANESSIYLIETKSLAKSRNIVLNKTWFDVKRIVSPKDEILQIFFAEFYTDIRDPLVPFITRAIVQHVHNILTDREMPEVDLETFDYSILHHNNSCAYSRFRSLILAKGIPLPSDICERFKEYISTKEQRLDVYMIDPIGDFIPDIVASLQVEPRINTLILQTPKRGILWNILGNCLSTNTTLQSIISYEPLTDDFENVIEGLKKNTRSKVRNFSILRAKVTRKYTRMFADMLEIRPLDSLTISNSLSGGAAIDFGIVLETAPSMQCLKHLYLDGTKGIDVSQIVRASKNMETLSLANCSIELCLLFGFLAIELNMKIKKLNLSGNRAICHIKETLILPESLETIICTNIIYHFDNLSRIIKLFAQKPLDIDLGRATAHEVAWLRAIDSLDAIESPPFVGFGWSENRISLQLLDFLDRCENLKKLDFSGCIDADSPIFPDIIQFITTNDSIEQLKVSGTSLRTIPPTALPVLISTLRENKTLRGFDVSGNTLNNSILGVLADVLMSNRRMRKVSLSFNEISEGENLKTFFARLAKRSAPLEMNYPDTDVKRLLRRRALRDSEAAEIEANFARMLRGEEGFVDDYQRPSERKPRIRRVPPAVPRDIPEDEFVEAEEEVFEPGDWEVVQPPVGPPDDSFFISVMQQKYDIDRLIDSVVSAL